MTPVDQTVLGGIPHGNCFAACVATIFGLKIEDVPHDMGNPEWLEMFRRWLRRTLRYDALCLAGDNIATIAKEIDSPCIVSGFSERGVMHATVWFRGGMFHDPHPDRTGLTAIVDVIVFIPVGFEAYFRKGGTP